MKPGASTRSAILELTDARWVAFAAAHPEAIPFHHPEWGALVAECYGFHAFAVVAMNASGAVTAGVPMVEVRHRPARAKWVALPFTDFCPPLLSSSDDAHHLASALRTTGADASIRRIEVRGALPGAAARGPVAIKHVLTLAADPTHTFERFHRSQVQRNIRRAEREGLTVRQGDRPQDLIDTFYRLHLQTRRRQGVPVQPRRFFHLLWERAISTGLGSVVIVESADQPLAAAVFLAWNGTVIYKFGASDERSWSLRPNHLLFWHVIRNACEQGYRSFDFGRTDTDHEGLRSFKRSWGAREEPLEYSLFGTVSTPNAHPHRRTSYALRSVIQHSPALVCRACGELLYRFVA